MTTHSSIIAWRIPWIEELGRLHSIGLQRVGHNWSDLACRWLINAQKQCSKTSSIWLYQHQGLCGESCFFGFFFCSWCLDPLYFITYCTSQWLKLYLWDFHICISWPIFNWVDLGWIGSIYIANQGSSFRKKLYLFSSGAQGPSALAHIFHLHKEVSLTSRPLSASASGFDSQGIICLWPSA